MSQPFWGYDMSVLLSKTNWLNVFPTKQMDLNEQYNSITRGIIYISLFFFIINNNTSYLLLGIISLAIIYYLFYSKYKNQVPKLLGLSKIKSKSKSRVVVPKPKFKNHSSITLKDKLYTETIDNNLNQLPDSIIIENPVGDEQEKLAKWLYLK